MSLIEEIFKIIIEVYKEIFLPNKKNVFTLFFKESFKFLYFKINFVFIKYKLLFY